MQSPSLSRALWRVVNGINARFVGYDRRVRFRDLARVPAQQRRSASRIINFYSAVNNIGNYLPVLGIRRMLGCEPDTWNIHDPTIDFDFINRHYQHVVIGGAGLLEKGFEPFWTAFARDCRLPAVIWGIGTCAPDRARSHGVDRALFARAAARCSLINLRDDLTADYYGIRTASVTPCPTIVYLQELFPHHRRPDSGGVLYASHEELVSEQERASIRRELSRHVGAVAVTDNIQRRLCGLNDILRTCYGRSRLVVTTRLHGAIVAYGMGIPYIALPRDEKVRAFQRLYGNGVLVDEVAQLPDAIDDHIACGEPVQYEQARAFGRHVMKWLASS